MEYNMDSQEIKLYNEENSCDDAFTEDIDHRIGCYDDEGNFLRYRNQINGVEIYIVYSIKEKLYMAFFRKMNTTFQPEETSFTAKTWDILEQHIEGESRNYDFSQFVGIIIKKKILKVIKENAKPIFLNFPK